MIPVNEPLLGKEEEEAVSDCVRSGWISSSGPYLEEFEQGWSAYCGREHGIAVANGTVALQLAVAALRIGEGDEVILPSFTIISCVLAVIYQGAAPVLVDADPETWCMDVSQVEAKITSRTKAVMPVHMYGHPVNMNPLLQLAKERGLSIVEDAAEAHGAEYLVGDSWRRCGSFGDVSTFSFYANKLVTTGEGGMVVTDDADLAERCRSLRNLSFEQARRFHHEQLGFNFRLTNLQSALGVVQLRKIERTIERKRWMASEYGRRLGELQGLQLPPEKEWAKSVYWMYGVVVDEAMGMNGVDVAQALANNGIETRPFFLGMHSQPVLKRMGFFEGESYPVTDRLSKQGLYLPSGAAITLDQIERTCDVLREVLA